MPGMAGNQCLMQPMKNNPQAELIKAGAGSLVHKSYDTKRFLKTVREVLDSD